MSCFQFCFHPKSVEWFKNSNFVQRLELQTFMTCNTVRSNAIRYFNKVKLLEFYKKKKKNKFGIFFF